MPFTVNVYEGSRNYASESVTKVSYDKKGNLVIKANYLNYSGHKITALKNVNIQIRNQDRDIIGTYTIKTKKVSIANYKSKTFTYTLKKSKLKKKKTQDLRLSDVNSTWVYQYKL